MPPIYSDRGLFIPALVSLDALSGLLPIAEGQDSAPSRASERGAPSFLLILGKSKTDCGERGQDVAGIADAELEHAVLLWYVVRVEYTQRPRG